MSLEDLTGPNKYIANLVPANPPATDPASQGCDHIQGIKNVLQNSFPGMAGPYAFGPTDEPMTWNVGGAERMKIATDGKVTIKNGIYSDETIYAPQMEIGSLYVPGTTFIDFHSDGTTTDYNARILRNTGANGSFDIGNNGTGSINLATGGNVRFKLDSSGNGFFPTASAFVLMGTETPINVGDAGSNFGWSFVGGGAVRQNFPAASEGFQLNASNYASGTTYLMVFRAGTASARGFISFDGTNVAYTNSSDYRLKKDIAPIQNALSKVALLKPCTFSWKENGKQASGFIAHELQAIIPESVVGEKDAIDQNGEMIIQGVDPGKIVSYLVAAIQELTARVQELEAR
jgi:hypothetical protein